MLRYHTRASKREQALCVEALASGKFDEMSDKDWVYLCESISRDEKEEAKRTAQNLAER